jgi:hypothetical protein
MAEPTCGTCKHLFVGEVNPQDLRDRPSFCRRLPPWPSLVGVDPQAGPVYSSAFPRVHPDLCVCGEWSPKVSH